MRVQSSLGDSLLAIQKEDFEKCFSYFRLFRINCDAFNNGGHLALIRCAHKAAFTINLWFQELRERRNLANTYFDQLRLDAVQLLPSIFLGNRRTLHLYERACIEDFFQYFYYFDHRVEYILVQRNPTNYESNAFLISWIKNYPSLSSVSAFVEQSCDSLSSAWKDVSKTIHGAADGATPMGDNLKDLFKPLQNPTKEIDLMVRVFGNIFFLLALSKNDEFQSFGLEEKKLACQQLSVEQKKVLSNFKIE